MRSATSLTGRALLAAALLCGTAGCDLHFVPFDDPSPRSLVLPRLTRQCLEGFGKPVTIELLDAGAEPRRSLRSAVDGLDRGGLALVGRSPEGALAVDHVLELEWQARGAQGQHCFQFAMRGALTADREAETGPVMGVLGVGRNGMITVSSDAIDEGSYAIEGELLRRIGMVQPLVVEEPVGVGARWRYRTDGHLRGEYISLDVTYEVLAHEGGLLRLGMRRHLVRPEQTVKDPRGESHRLEAIDERVRGVLEVDLGRSPLPTARLIDEGGQEVEQIIVAWQ